jgi:hypothetical protein
MLKRSLFILAMLVGTWMTIEVIALIGHATLDRVWFPKSRIKHDLRQVLRIQNGTENIIEPTVAGLDWEGFDYVEALHPYFGYVPDPHASAERYQVSPMGFHDASGGLSPPRRASDQIVIGFFGGSFALGTIDSARTGLSHCLEFLGKKVVVRNFSAGGYKQPQQLHIFAHLLATGAEFDVVINIDGFNEMALPIAENLPAGVHPLFPRRWHDRVDAFRSPARARRIGIIGILEESRRRWAALFHGWKLYRSPALALVWQTRDRRLDADIFELREELRMAEETNLDMQFQQQGPDFPQDEDAIYALLAETWSDASLQMAILAAGNGAHYLHFLQPNQYLEGSKPMTIEERKLAVVLDHAYRPPVVKGYPLLVEAGQDLKRKGVAFHDLRRIYSDRPEPLYIDACCHVNARGYEIVTEQLCEAVIEAIEDEQEIDRASTRPNLE